MNEEKVNLYEEKYNPCVGINSGNANLWIVIGGNVLDRLPEVVHTSMVDKVVRYKEGEVFMYNVATKPERDGSYKVHKGSHMVVCEKFDEALNVAINIYENMKEAVKPKEEEEKEGE